jgi:protein-S-isoprenylcysteine O-methyltransferase Ste14
MAQHLGRLKILCGAILAGVVVFAAVVWFLLSSGTFTPPEAIPSYMATLLNLAGLLLIVSAHFLPRFFHRPPKEAPGEAHLARHGQVTIITFALREGGALVALVGALVTGEMLGGVAVASLAVVTMVLAWPRAEQIFPEAWARP